MMGRKGASKRKRKQTKAGSVPASNTGFGRNSAPEARQIESQPVKVAEERKAVSTAGSRNVKKI